MFGFGLGIHRLGSFGVDTLAALQAIPAPEITQRPTGFVFADPLPSNNGIYTWSGVNWKRERGLPELIATLGTPTGTANAIIASPQGGVDIEQTVLLILKPNATNTGAVVLNGWPLRNGQGSPLVAGALSAGMSYLIHRGASEYRVLLSNFATIADIGGLKERLDYIEALSLADQIDYGTL